MKERKTQRNMKIRNAESEKKKEAEKQVEGKFKKIIAEAETETREIITGKMVGIAI